MILMQYFFLIFFIKAYVVGTHFELPRLVQAIQMSTNNICFHNEVDKKYIACNLA